MAAPATLADKILAHLARHPVPEGAIDVAPEVTQEGIASVLGARVAHVSRGLKGLQQAGHVTARLARARGSRRKSRAYELTDTGRHAARADLVSLAPPPLPSPVAPLPRRGPPAGRDAPWTTLLGLFDEARGQGARAVLIEGDAGCGKTRLLEDLGAEFQRRGARLGVGRGVPLGDAQLLGPLHAALAPFGFDALFQSRAAGTMRERALAAAVEAIETAARKAPVALLLDDLHVAGPSVAEFVHGLFLALPPPTRVLVVAAFRREEAWELPNGDLYAALAPLRAEPRAAHVVLDGLDRAGVAALLADAGAKLPDPLFERVLAESEGNAMYALAMAEALADGVDESDFFPEAVRQKAKERIHSLSGDPLHVLQVAAVAGVEVEYPLLVRAYDGPEARLVAALDVLLDRLLLEETPRGGDVLRLRFDHPKVREAVLADLTSTRRRFLETRLAEAHATS